MKLKALASLFLLGLTSCATEPTVRSGPLDAPAATRRYANSGPAPVAKPGPAPVHGGQAGFQNIETAP